MLLISSKSIRPRGEVTEYVVDVLYIQLYIYMCVCVYVPRESACTIASTNQFHICIHGESCAWTHWVTMLDVCIVSQNC